MDINARGVLEISFYGGAQTMYCRPRNGSRSQCTPPSDRMREGQSAGQHFVKRT